MQLQSYVYGEWRSGEGQGVALRDATTGEAVAEATSAGLDFRAVLAHAREVGGPALRALTFHERAALLKALATYSPPWTAQFRCAVALADPSGAVHYFEGICPGEIISNERGQNGFGYDPIFFLPGLGLEGQAAFRAGRGRCGRKPKSARRC